MKQSAAGLDGWSGQELSCWPRCAWEQYAKLVNAWFKSQSFPQEWCDFRQVHLPKQALHSRPHCPADKLRPIVVERSVENSCLSMGAQGSNPGLGTKLGAVTGFWWH